MLARPARILAAACVALALSLSSAARAEVIVATGPSAYTTIFSKIIDPLDKEKGVKLRIHGDPLKSSSFETLMAVASGQATVGVASLPYDTWLKSVQDREPKIPNVAELTQRVIGHDKIRVATHPGVGVQKLTQENIEGLFGGKVRNWKEIGGSDAPVTIVLVDKNKATTDYFRKKALHGKDFGANHKTAKDFEEGVALTESTPGAVLFGTSEGLKGNLGHPSHPEYGRPMTLITVGKPSAEVQKLLQYIQENQAKFDIN